MTISLSSQGKATMVERLQRIMNYANWPGRIADVQVWLEDNIGLSADDQAAVIELLSQLGWKGDSLGRTELEQLLHALTNGHHS